MNDIARKRVENAVATFVAKRRPPVHLRDQVDLSFRFDGRSVETFSRSGRGGATPLSESRKQSRKLAT